MAISIFNTLTLLLGIFAATYQLCLKHRLEAFGVGRVISPLNNEDCKIVPSLPACEKLILHQPTGLVYLACSTPSSRVHWTPGLSRLNTTGASRTDYVATYDPQTSEITRLEVNNFVGSRGLSLHGMDVVPSESSLSELFVYLVNHRAPLGNLLATEVGADSVIEVFSTTPGGPTLTHIKTVENAVILTPNDIVGSADGKSFYFTNDHGSKVGLVRELDLLGRSMSSVGYCHLDKGCHYAIQKTQAYNGIARGSNGTIYTANAYVGGLNIHKEQQDHTLVLKEFIPTDRPMDNLSIDSKGFVWAAGFPDVLTLLFKHFSDPSIPAASSALRFSTKDPGSGPSLKVEKLFEDDGSIASGITSVAYDVDRNLLFLAGLASPHLTVCKLRV